MRKFKAGDKVKYISHIRDEKLKQDVIYEVLKVDNNHDFLDIVGKTFPDINYNYGFCNFELANDSIKLEDEGLSVEIKGAKDEHVNLLHNLLEYFEDNPKIMESIEKDANAYIKEKRQAEDEAKKESEDFAGLVAYYQYNKTEKYIKFLGYYGKRPNTGYPNDFEYLTLDEVKQRGLKVV